MIGFDPYFLNIAPEEKRTTLLGIRGTFNILTVILPLTGGLIIELFGFTITFYLVTIIMILAFFLLIQRSGES